MRLMIIAFKAALAGSCLVVAACGDNGSAASETSATNTVKGSVMKASVARTASLSGTIIPTATQIIDSSGNVWTVTGGIIYKDGSLAGYSNAVTKLLYDGKTIYQENVAGGWWSWNGTTWVATADPTKVASPNGTSIPTVTQITDSTGNVWIVSDGVIYKDGALAGYSNAVTTLVYNGKTIYQENAAGGWWSWNGNTWVSSSNPTSTGGGGTSSTGSASLSWTVPTQNTNGTPLTDLAGYKISYGTSPGALTQTIQVADPSASSYVVGNLSPGPFYFAVAAYTTMGIQSAESTEGSKTIP